MTQAGLEFGMEVVVPVIEDGLELSEPALLIRQGDRTYLQRIATKSTHHYDIPALARKKKICCSYYEWAVIKDVNSPHCCLLNLISQERIQLPRVSFRHARFSLSSHPADPACHLVVYDKRKKAFKFCRPGDHKFVRKKDRGCSIPNPAGKVYFLLGDGSITCLEFDDSTSYFRKLDLDSNSRDWTASIGRRTMMIRTYLAAWYGELFLIRRYVYENSSDNATGFSVSKADFSKNVWVEVKSIAPLTILLTTEKDGISHMCCPGHDSGIMSNAIYFLEKHDKNYYAYSLEDESITMYPTDCARNAKTSWLVFPPSLQRDHNIEEKEKEEISRQDWEEETSEESWASLLPELLSGILSNLFARDYVVFHGVCKSWQRITTRHSSSILQQQESNMPLLMFLENREVPTYKLFDPIQRKYQTLEIPELKGADIRYSAHGWLLASGRRSSEESLFFLNPLTQERLELPFPFFLADSNLYFSSPPTSSDCLIVSMWGTGVYVGCMTLRRSENAWRKCIVQDKPHKHLFPCCSPVVHHGLHYYVCEDRSMVAFDLYGNEIRLVNSWSTNLQRTLTNTVNILCDDEDFLMEIDGVPALVIVPRDGKKKKINIFKWDVLQNDWIRMEDTDLGHEDMFLSRRSSFLEKVDYGGGIGNKIFLTLVDKDAMNGLFYSLKTQKYHTFYSGYSRESYFGAAKFHGGIWLKPLFTRSEDKLTW